MLGLRINTPKTAKAGGIIKLDLVQPGESGKNIVGVLAIEIRVN